MKEARVLKTKNYIGYGVTDMFGGGAFAVISAWIMFFYVTYCGLTPIEAGSILFIARILDTIISPLVGYVTDHFGNTRVGKKFGRRRFFLLLGCPLLVIYSLMWVADMNYFYYLITYLMMEIIAAMIIIPYETIASEMTSNYKERTKLSAFRIVFGGLGTFMATFIPGRLFTLFGDDSARVFFINGAIFTLISMVVVMITYFTTWERLHDIPSTAAAEVRKPKLSLGKMCLSVFKDMFSTLKIRAFRQHLTMYILSFTAMDLLSSVFTFFIIYALHQNAALAANLMSVGIFCFGWGTAVFAWGFIRYTPARLLQLCYLAVMLCMLAYTAFYFYTTSWMIPALYAIAFIHQLFKGGYVYLSWNIYPFIPDVDEVVTRKRREGIFAGMMTFVRKSTLGISALLVGLILEMSGFVTGAKTQPTQAVDAIVAIVSLGTIALLLISFFVAARFKLNNKSHQILLEEIERLKVTDGDKSQVTAETRIVIEDLTGMKYEDVWQGDEQASDTHAVLTPVTEKALTK